MYAIGIQKTAGWEWLLDLNGNIKTAATPTDLITEVRTKYPPSKLTLVEVLTLNPDYTWDGGSTSGEAQKKRNMEKKLL